LADPTIFPARGSDWMESTSLAAGLSGVTAPVFRDLSGKSADFREESLACPWGINPGGLYITFDETVRNTAMGIFPILTGVTGTAPTTDERSSE
jgi:hypothetical protein